MAALTTFGKRFNTEEQVVSQVRPEETQLKPVPPPRETFTAFIRRVAPWFRVYRMTETLIAALEKGYMEGGWLWINIPPRLGKTKLLQLFCAWVKSEDLLCDIGYCSFGQRLANRSSKDARDFYTLAGGNLDNSVKSKVEWASVLENGTSGGMMWAAGPGGQVRGSGYHIGIIDDLHKNSRELLSEAKTEAFQDFWDNTWLNRAQAHTHRPILRIVVGQRLGDNDIFGYIKEQAELRKDGAKWYCVVLDAFKNGEDQSNPDEDIWNFIPAGASLASDWRIDGENLEPLVVTADFILTNCTNPAEWLAQFQQRPKALKGKIIDPMWFPIIFNFQAPAMQIKVAGGDLAVKKGQDNDWWVFFPIGLGSDNKIYVFKPWREKSTAQEAKTQIPAFLVKHRVAMACIEAVAFQEAFSGDLRLDSMLAGISIVSPDMLVQKQIGPTQKLSRTDKESNARAWAPMASQGRIILVEDFDEPWVELFKAECRSFPRGAHDDQIDALGFAVLALRMFMSQLADGDTTAVG